MKMLKLFVMLLFSCNILHYLFYYQTPKFYENDANSFQFQHESLNLIFKNIANYWMFKSHFIMVFILDGCSFHGAHVWCKQGLFRKNDRIWRLFWCNQMPSTNRNVWFTPCVRIVKWATMIKTMMKPIAILVLT